MAVKLETTIKRFIGASGDAKPTGVPVGSTYYAYDTKAMYITYDGTNWVVKNQGLEQSVEKADGAVLAGSDDLFTISGGAIIATEIVGVVTTLIGGAANCHLDMVVTTPAGTVPMSTNVAIDNDAAGTTYWFTTVAVPVLTPVTAGAVPNHVAAKWLLPIGTVKAHCDSAEDGVISWEMFYKPLTPNSIVVPAA